MITTERVEQLIQHFTAHGSIDENTAAIPVQADTIRALKLLFALMGQGDIWATLITDLSNGIHADNVKAGWWTDPKTGEDLHGKRNVPEMLCLIHSEISEAMEGYRKRLNDDKLPHRPMLRVELIDALIRIFDLLGSEQNDEHPAGTIFQEKRAYNANRADHKLENRLKPGGKAF